MHLAKYVHILVSAHCIMTPTDDIEKIYLEYFKKTFDNLGLEKYERLNGPGHGGWIKFKNSSFRLQLLDDRGLIETDISPLFGQEQFRGIEMYNSLLTLIKSPDNLSQSEKRKILGTRLDYHAQATFLLDNMEKLKNILDKKHYEDTLRQINNLGQERFK